MTNKRSTTDVRQIFQTVYNHQTNFLTPIVVRYGVAGDYFYELSKSDHIFKNVAGHDMFGVTVILGNEKKNDLSKAFTSEDEAETYIKELRGL